MLSFVLVAALIIGVALVVSRMRSQAPGQTTHDTWNDPTSPAFFSSDSDTSPSHDSGGWADMHGGGGSWDSDSSGGDSSSGSDN